MSVNASSNMMEFLRRLKEARETATDPTRDDLDLEPRRPAAVALVIVGVLFLALPNSIAAGCNWLPLVFIVMMFVPLSFTRRHGWHAVNHIMAIVLISLVTLYMLLSFGFAAFALLHRLDSPSVLLRTASSLWASNVLVFAWWYWRLDAGGPHVRGMFYGHRNGAFLFPQMTLSPVNLVKQNMTDWTPGYLDYLFVAFNTSTALSPTDTPVLSIWAKLLTMLQSSISLGIITFLAARAVGIL